MNSDEELPPITPTPTPTHIRGGGHPKRDRPFGSRNLKPGNPRWGARKELIRPHESDPFFAKMVADITKDRGGACEVSRVMAELNCTFAGTATLIQSRNTQIASGRCAEINITEFTALASTLLRYSMRLELHQSPARENTRSVSFRLQQKQEHH